MRSRSGDGGYERISARWRNMGHISYTWRALWVLKTLFFLGGGGWFRDCASCGGDCGVVAIRGSLGKHMLGGRKEKYR